MALSAEPILKGRRQYVRLVDEHTGKELALLTRAEAMNLALRLRAATKKKGIPGVKPRPVIRGD